MVLNWISHNYDFAVSTLPNTHITQGVRLQGTVETTQAVWLPLADVSDESDQDMVFSVTRERSDIGVRKLWQVAINASAEVCYEYS